MGRLFENLPEGAQAELYRRVSRSWGVRFQNSTFEGTSESRLDTKTVRVIQSGKLSMASGSRPGSEADLLRTALELSKYGTQVDYDFPGVAEYGEIELASPEVPAMDFAEMIDICEDLISSVLKVDPDIRASASVGAEELEVSLDNSNGFSGKYTKTVLRAGLGVRYVQGDDFLRFGESRASWTNDLDYEGIKEEVIRLFKWAKQTVDMTAGTYPVIFAPEEVGHLTRPFIASLNGKAVTRGISPLEEKIGQELLDPRVTLIDDGTVPREVSSVPFDREGVPTQRNVLIDKGVPKTILTDLETARKLGTESTGNGSGRGPAPHRVILLPGDQTLEQLIAGIDLGVIVFGTMGAWTGNPLGGNVSGTISLGLKIVNGEIAGRVKNCMFSINSFKHFKDHLIGFSRETKSTRGATYPYVALDEVVITSG
ncbi:MAG: TldD/PmbA family protein [Bacillota bacterium]|jgi:PmbA protein|nr:TldD/PmbA family protein [Candidatus Fermentithermobacillaceae bacterium]HOA71377.1 TldD/PmbA family protein [Bacillota bacterium]HOP70431.1 TldD/PmbA family protein [Bacillota bacterium]HPT35946.1 TldD/PmbA family protein [Bacillota bacterium]HPZ86038.1 TldD/PmbA family protein [Bacillota bacterium]